MNLTHKLSFVALIVLSLITTGMLVQHQISAKRLQVLSEKNAGVDLKKFYARRIARDTEIFKEVVSLLNQKQFSPAMEKLKAIQAAHPENPKSFVYQAQLNYNLGRLAKAIHSYRLAVDKEPDFVDKKTPLFIGNKIMKLINEGRSKLHREKKLKPGDTSIKLALEDVYYLQRRIAGGCE